MDTMTQEIKDLSMEVHQDKSLHATIFLMVTAGLVFASSFLARRKLKTQTVTFSVNGQDETVMSTTDNTSNNNDDGLGVTVVLFIFAVMLYLSMISFFDWAGSKFRTVKSTTYVYNPKTGLYEPKVVKKMKIENSSNYSSGFSDWGAFFWGITFGLLL